MIYVRLPHYVASYLRHREDKSAGSTPDTPDDDILVSGQPFAPRHPFRIVSGDPLYSEVLMRAQANLYNDVNIDCFSERQWVAMRKGKYIGNTNELHMVMPRKPNAPLLLCEIYELAGRTDLIHYDADGKPIRDDMDYNEVYMPFALPDTIYVNGKAVRTYSDWYLPRTKDFITELRERYKNALIRWIAKDQEACIACGVRRSKAESIDRFMGTYHIRTGDREREQHKKLVNRAYLSSLYMLDHDVDHGLWSGEKAVRPKRTADMVPVRCLDDGKDYDSIADAARHYGLDRKTLSNAIARGYRCKGFMFEKKK